MKVEKFEFKDKYRMLKDENRKLQKASSIVDAEKTRLEAIIYGPKQQSSRNKGGRSKSPMALKNS